MNQNPITIRPAQLGDEQHIADLIYGLALYEEAPEKCFATAETVRREIFGDRPSAEVLMAFDGERPVAFALFFQSFSTWLCRPGMYLEDLFVVPEYRKRGIGGTLLRRLAEMCVERGYGRMEWACLEWNELAKSQYRKIGAAPLEEWRTWRLEGDSIADLAEA